MKSYQNGELSYNKTYWYDTKRICKVLAERLKKVIPSLISKTQTDKGRFVREETD